MMRVYTVMTDSSMYWLENCNHENKEHIYKHRKELI